MSCREAADCEYLWKSKSDLVKYHTFLVLIAIQPISGVLSIGEEKSNTSQDVSMIITAPSPPSSLLNAGILQTIYPGHLSNHYSSMLQGMKLAPAHVHYFWSKNCSYWTHKEEKGIKSKKEVGSNSSHEVNESNHVHLLPLWWSSWWICAVGCFCLYWLLGSCLLLIFCYHLSHLRFCPFRETTSQWPNDNLGVLFRTIVSNHWNTSIWQYMSNNILIFTWNKIADR